MLDFTNPGFSVLIAGIILIVAGILAFIFPKIVSYIVGTGWAIAGVVLLIGQAYIIGSVMLVLGIATIIFPSIWNLVVAANLIAFGVLALVQGLAIENWIIAGISFLLGLLVLFIRYLANYLAAAYYLIAGGLLTAWYFLAP